jgi:hypothetical protein
MAATRQALDLDDLDRVAPDVESDEGLFLAEEHRFAP